MNSPTLIPGKFYKGKALKEALEEEDTGTDNIRSIREQNIYVYFSF